jgi:hypothetical protein
MSAASVKNKYQAIQYHYFLKNLIILRKVKLKQKIRKTIV